MGSHPNQKQMIHRFSRIIGHTEAIKRMIIEEKECEDILIQIAAVRSALNNAGKIILKEHISHCTVDAVKNNDPEALDKLNKAIDKFMK